MGHENSRERGAALSPGMICLCELSAVGRHGIPPTEAARRVKVALRFGITPLLMRGSVA